MAKKTMVETAYEVLANNAGEMQFGPLFTAVADEMNIAEGLRAAKKRQLYASLLEDTRFAALKGNHWDLRNRRKYEELHEIDDVADDSDESSEEDIIEDEEDGGLLDLPSSSEQY